MYCAPRPLTPHMETMQKNHHNPFSTAPGDFYDNLLTMSQYNSLTPEEQMEYTRARMYANDEKLRILRSRAEVIAEGEAKGRAEGIAEGELKGKWEDARNFYNLGVDIDTIAKATGLPVESLIKELVK